MGSRFGDDGYIGADSKEQIEKCLHCTLPDCHPYRCGVMAEKHPDRRKRFSNDDYKRILELYEQGKNDTQIAGIIGCSKKPIYLFRLKNNLPAQPHKKRVKKEE